MATLQLGVRGAAAPQPCEVGVPGCIPTPSKATSAVPCRAVLGVCVAGSALSSLADRRSSALSPLPAGAGVGLRAHAGMLPYRLRFARAWSRRPEEGFE